MTGFLGGLIDRAQGRMPALERRPRALFEPERPMAGGFAEGAQEHVASLPAAVPRAAMPGEPVMPRREASRAPEPMPAASAREPGPVEANKLPPTLQRLATLPAPERTTRDATQPRTPIANVATPPRTREARHEAPPPRHDRIVERLREPQPAFKPHATPLLTAPVPPRSLPPVATAPRHAAPRAAALPATPAAVPAPPAVHIAIGRVEVKAVAAAQAPRRASAVAPRLSLDDYLRRRSGD